MSETNTFSLLKAPRNYYHDGIFGYRVVLKGQKMEELHIPLRDFKKTFLLTEEQKKAIQEILKNGRNSSNKVKGEIIVYKYPIQK